jgi:hypothetical protein
VLFFGNTPFYAAVISRSARGESLLTLRETKFIPHPVISKAQISLVPVHFHIDRDSVCIQSHSNIHFQDGIVV